MTMTQYISKDVLMSQLNIEISNLHKAESEGYLTEFGKGKLEGLEGIADFIVNYCDSEVDLDKEFDNYTKDIFACDVQSEPFTQLYKCAKYFFELGIKTQKGGEE